MQTQTHNQPTQLSNAQQVNAQLIEQGRTHSLIQVAGSLASFIAIAGSMGFALSIGLL